MGRSWNVQQFHRHLAFLPSFSWVCFFYNTTMSAQQQSCPQSSWLSWTLHLTDHPLSPGNATKQSTSVYLLWPVWHLTQSPPPCPAAIQLSTTSVIHGHNVFSVFLKQMSLKTFFMTHTTYTPSSAWKYHSHTHNTTLSKTIALGNWGILTRNEAKMNQGNDDFPSYLGPHPEMSGGNSSPKIL